MSRLHVHWMRCCAGCLGWALVALAAAPAAAADDAPRPAAAKTGRRTGATAAKTEKPATQRSDAERIAELNRAIQGDTEQLEKLSADAQDLDEPDSEFSKAKADFEEIDQSLKAKKKALAEHKNAGRTAEAEALATEVAAIEKKRALARDRFNLAIEARKTLKTRIAALQRKIEQDSKALAKLLGEPAAGGPTATAPASRPAVPPTAAVPTAQPAPPAAPGAAVATSQPAPGQGKEPPRQEVVEQQAKVQETEARAKEADQTVQTLDEQIEALNATIQNETKAVDQAREAVGLARKAVDLAREEYDREFAKPEADRASWEALQALRKRSREADRRARKAQAEVSRLTDRLGVLKDQRADLQRERIAALQEAGEKRQAAEVEQKKLAKLKNPYSLHNILQWFVDHGPKVALILLGMALVQFLVKLVSGHFVTLLTRSSREETPEERENRAKTLVGVFRYAASVVIVIGGIVMILQELGVPVGPVMGGAAVFGLAIAFGAQNLVRDYFHGFVILLENQYGVNDVVKLAGISGLVERITLRITVLRDLEGVVHFIPHGQIKSVSNMTHGWSRALFSVGVAYKEDVDRVMDVLAELGRELRQDPQFGPHILEDLTMLGVDSMGESAIIIKFFIKTRQLQQWGVKREMLRRIKKKFDALGIEIPFPHRTIYHHYEVGTPPPPPEQSGPHWT